MEEVLAVPSVREWHNNGWAAAGYIERTANDLRQLLIDKDDIPAETRERLRFCVTRLREAQERLAWARVK